VSLTASASGARKLVGETSTTSRAAAEVNSFMPTFTIPFFAWSATAAEPSLGIALIIEIWPRWVALGI
jgi:uncharacterized membrane protein YphA (DoxX/SURF4 family)